MGRGLIPGTIWKISCHYLFITYFTLTFFEHWLLYCRKDLWIDKLQKLILKGVAFVQLANIFVWGLVSKRYQTMSIYTMTLETVKSTHAVDIWMEIPIQHDVYIWANYSVSSYLSFIPIFWNVLMWLKYDFMNIFMHQLSLYFDIESLRPLHRYRKLN